MQMYGTGGGAQRIYYGVDGPFRKMVTGQRFLGYSNTGNRKLSKNPSSEGGYKDCRQIVKITN